MIIVLGSINMDLVFVADHAPEAGETILLKDYSLFPGGKGANQAVASARMGASVMMAGCVGDDGFGQQMRDTLRQQGIDISTIHVQPEGRTGTAVITVDKTGENRIMVASGTNAAVSADLVDDKHLAAGRTILMQMEIPPEQVKAMAKRAYGKVDQVILNLAPMVDPGDETLAHVDMLILNEIEIVQLAAARQLPHDQGYEQAAARMAKDFSITCMITLGTAGAKAFLPDGRVMAAPALKIDHVVDTTGAGDAFCGVLAAALDQGASLEQAMNQACVAGSLACLKLGAMSSYPQRHEVEEALKAAA